MPRSRTCSRRDASSNRFFLHVARLRILSANDQQRETNVARRVRHKKRKRRMRTDRGERKLRNDRDVGRGEKADTGACRAEYLRRADWSSARDI